MPRLSGDQDAADAARWRACVADKLEDDSGQGLRNGLYDHDIDDFRRDEAERKKSDGSKDYEDGADGGHATPFSNVDASRLSALTASVTRCVPFQNKLPHIR